LNAAPRKQWGDSGGFCGSVSIQVIGLSYGVYHSQDVIRKQAGPGTPPGHGDEEEGYEILHSNIEGALDKLGLTYNSWDWERQQQPQGKEYLSFMKENLAKGSGIVQFVLCKGDRHNSYGPVHDPVPYDHIEPFFKLYSKHPLNDTSFYADDVVVHGSDYSPDGEANLGYFRTFDSLLDDKRMEGNCADAGDGYGKNEMYPCIYDVKTYGYAIDGVKAAGVDDVPVSVLVDTTDEPDIREDEPPGALTATLVLEEGSFTVYRFDGLETFPQAGGGVEGASFKYEKVVNGFVDPNTFMSDTSVMYKVVR